MYHPGGSPRTPRNSCADLSLDITGNKVKQTIIVSAAILIKQRRAASRPFFAFGHNRRGHSRVSSFDQANRLSSDGLWPPFFIRRKQPNHFSRSVCMSGYFYSCLQQPFLKPVLAIQQWPELPTLYSNNAWASCKPEREIGFQPTVYELKLSYLRPWLMQRPSATEKGVRFGLCHEPDQPGPTAPQTGRMSLRSRQPNLPDSLIVPAGRVFAAKAPNSVALIPWLLRS